MNSKYKQQWLAALRSGEFMQCREVMRLVGQDGQERFCVLGVLAELVRREHPDKFNWKRFGKDPAGNARFDLRPKGGGQPGKRWWNAIERKLGVHLFGDTMIDYLGEAHTISELNDDFGVTFAEAADLIEAQL
ncbi:hypothetical protein PLCT2_00256 [Planctomycetaceae bacterium]|nr:hypothetical protein PLCT2_00256 [Planctomycetaceae bacterium]